MSLQPRDAGSLDSLIFDEGCVRTRLNELTQGFITKLELEEKAKLGKDHFEKQLKLKKPLPKPQWRELSGGEREERYGKKARKLAEKIIEQERQNYVDAKAERDKNMLVEIAKKLRFLTWIVDEEGKPTKLKMVEQEEVRPTDLGGTRTIQYVGDHDFERLRQINLLKGKLMQLSCFVPYYSEEIKTLYKEAVELGTLEYEEEKVEKLKPQSVEKPRKIKKTKKPVKTKKKAKT